ncbi:MAG: hypothetical protein ACPGUV_01710 [Polyangiales bacterium]
MAFSNTTSAPAVPEAALAPRPVQRSARACRRQGLSLWPCAVAILVSSCGLVVPLALAQEADKTDKESKPGKPAQGAGDGGATAAAGQSEATASGTAQGEATPASGVAGAPQGEADAAAEPGESAASGAAAGSGSNQASAAPTVSAGTYAVRLRDLEERINGLKEQVFRSKSRLALLAETVLQGVVAGSQARIVHVNKMSSSYRLVKVMYALDGAPIFNRADDEGSLGENESFDVFNGSIVPGEHTLTVSLEYRGHGYGIFSYLKGYRFKTRSSHTFRAPEGKGIRLRVVGYEKGGPTAPVEERPAVRYFESAFDPRAAKKASGTRSRSR